MGETIVSPGVVANENNQSYVTQAPIQSGAAIVGPTVKGKVGIPTIVTTYSEYSNKFGTTFISGSSTYSYLTSISAYNYFNNGGTSLLVTRVASGSFTPATASVILPSTSQSFEISTLSEGILMNSDSTQFSDGTLASGSVDNLRYQVSSYDTGSGTFTLLVRQGNDSTYTPSVLETWSNLSLDPLSSNYIEKVIGNQYEQVKNDNGEYYIDLIGTYPNKSKYIRISNVSTPTPQYFDNSGNPKSQYTSSIPHLQSGSFGGALGSNIPSGMSGSYYENISNINPQGIPASAYTESINLLANKDAFKFNFITVPGLIADGTNYASHYPVITSLISIIQSRGDSMIVADLVGKGANILSVTSNALAIDNSYVATYWPWTQTIDPNTGQQVWVPASTLIPGVYAFNDSISEPWYAPAGTTRGVMSNVITTERNLTQGNRDSLYKTNVNGIATFPNSGVVVFGQKTLQKKPNALDRVGVRRLLIELKSYISQVANNLVFEQNTETTRNSFLSQVNPYLNSVKQREGLDDYKVVMDTSNNTPTTIDNNQLIGQIYLQPTKTIEFIILDFNILPSGISIS